MLLKLEYDQLREGSRERGRESEAIMCHVSV